jgi:mono/diheme cytochrome c family protein
MKTIKYLPILVLSLTMIVINGGCSKNIVDTSSLYTPSNANVTANATLQDLQQGRALYIANCNRCHALVSPDNYSPSQWKSVMSSMAPKTNMSASDIQLVTKYVSKGL